ncbi:TonB-dependent receptor [Granulicella paludicola]|uniref:TonB-dependent receptor n=1 Tax=Granulicella paludicola TaxID=474951 RepID=UPI0021E05963|nr:carboxypeptidase regulatory-like domain-containing protein [Granulicella paludicola]
MKNIKLILRISVELLMFVGMITISASTSYAQNSTGSISIRVTDTTGAVLPDVVVTVTGTDTGAQIRQLKSNTDGIANVPQVPPGRYNIEVSLQGFKTFQQVAVDVQVGATVTLTPALQIGASTDSVTITGETPLIEDKSQTVQQVIEAKELTDIPLNGRNYIQAANYIPGVVPENGGRDNSFVAYGNNGLQNAFLLDGARNVNYLRGLDNEQRDMVRPPLDALQEFTVQTSNYSAEFGASAGAVVNAITKSGTNKYHGSAYDFIRNDAADAKTYFYNPVSAPRKPQLVQNQYGGSLGGHIIKDKLFYFAAYEGVHTKASTFNKGVVPSDLERTGDFSQSKYPIYDPSTTTLVGTTYTRAQFAGNKILPTSINALGQQLVNLYPHANDVSADGFTHYYDYNIPSLADTKNGIGRLDWVLNARNSAFVRYGETLNNTFTGVGLPGAQDPGNSRVDSKGLGLGYTRIITSNLLNDLRFSWTTVNDHGQGTLPLNSYIPGLLDAAITEGIPIFNVTNFGSLGSEAVGNSPLSKTSGVWDWADNVSWSHGSHLWKFGGEVLWIRPNTSAASNGRGSLTFTGAFTQLPTTSATRTTSGSAVADFLLGYANSVGTGTTLHSQERGWYYGGYANDQWTVTPNLTLNYGLRYEVFTPFYDTNNGLGNFVTDVNSPLYLQYIKAGLDTRLPRALIYTDTNNIAPRVGLAYRVPHVKDMTVRSSYGIFYAQDQGSGITSRLSNNPPYNNYGAINQSSDQINTSTAFYLSATQTIPRPVPVTPASFVLLPTYTGGLTSWNTHMRTGYVQEWSLSVQKQLPSNMLVEVNYVGNHAIHLLGASNVNQPLVLNATTVQSRRPLSAVTQSAVNQIGDWNASQYEGVSAKLEKRFSHGVEFRNSLTYGRSFNLLGNSLDTCDTCGNSDALQNSYDHASNWGPSDYDIHLRYALTGAFESPFGHNHALLANNGIASAVLGGWVVSPIYTWQSGAPVTPGESDLANSGQTNRPNRTCDANAGAPRTIAKWFNTQCFVGQPQFTFGNSRKGSVYAPGQNQLNANIQRNFPVPHWKDSNLNFRLEGFNVLNHPQFSTPNLTLGSTAFGTITSAGTQRQLQAAVRLTF